MGFRLSVFLNSALRWLKSSGILCTLGCSLEQMFREVADSIALHWLTLCKGFTPLSEWVVGYCRGCLEAYLPITEPLTFISFISQCDIRAWVYRKGGTGLMRWTDLGEGVTEEWFNLKSCGASFQEPCSHQIPLFSHFLVFPSEWWNFSVKNDLGRSSGPKSLESIQAWVFLWFDLDVCLCHERGQPESGISSGGA